MFATVREEAMMQSATINDWKADHAAAVASSPFDHEIREVATFRYAVRARGCIGSHAFSSAPIEVRALPGNGGPNVFLEAAQRSERWMRDRADYYHRLLPFPHWTLSQTPTTATGKIEGAHAWYLGGALEAIELGTSDWLDLIVELGRGPDADGYILHDGVRVREGTSLRYIIRDPDSAA